MKGRWMVRRAHHESPLGMSKGHSSPSQRLSLRGMSPSGAEPEPAATFALWSNGIYSTGQALPPAYRRAGIKGGGDFVGEFNYL